MPTTKYLIDIDEKERKVLEDIVTKGVAKARTIMRAHVLLGSDRNGKKPMTVAEICAAYGCSPETVRKIREQYCDDGLDSVLVRKKREKPPVEAKVTGDVEARIIALACGDPPEGYGKWNLRLLAEKAVELHILESVSHMTVSRVLKKKAQS